MKKIATLIAFTLFAAGSFAQTPAPGTPAPEKSPVVKHAKKEHKAEAKAAVKTEVTTSPASVTK